MPVSVSYEEPGRFVIEATGDVSGSEAIEAVGRVRAHPRFRAGTTMLALARQVTKAPCTEELRDLATSVLALRDGGVAGIAIVTDPGFVYGVARMFSALADLAGVHVEVFLDLAEARSRLDELSARAA